MHGIAGKGPKPAHWMANTAGEPLQRGVERMEMTYRMTIAGCERELPLCRVSDTLYIAAFIMFGDVEITKACARELLKRAPAHDVMITAEAKGIPLLYEMAAQAGENRYLVARKAPKVYMRDVVSTEVRSITTQAQQTLYLSGEDAQYLQGKRVLIVDDVVSTGESIAALERLVVQLGGEVAGRMTVLAEGEAQNRGDIIYLEKLPTFHPDGTVMA